MSDKGWFSKLKEKWGNGEEGEKRVGTFQNLLILAGVGAAVMIFSSFNTVQQEAVPSKNNEQNQTEQPVFSNKTNSGDYSMAAYEEMYENQLKEILEEVIGIGKVSVMINLDSSEEVVVEKNLQLNTRTTKEVDKDRATRDITESTRDEQVILIQGEQGESPVVVKRVKPKIRGVLVVANGVESMKVKALISEAVQRVLHVEPHKISILPKKG